MRKRESGYAEAPGYRVEIEPHPGRARVSLGGETVAESDRSVVVRETGHAPVLYFPREDVRMGVLEASDHESFCPFKGEASYWTLRAGGRVEKDAAWSYLDPFEEVGALRGYLSFYTDRPGLVQES